MVVVAPRTARATDARNPSSNLLPTRDPLALRIEKLAQQERDAVRRRDWSSARIAAEERVAFQEARQRIAARRLS